ncbi:toxin-antitoxin system HicB family antitoxin [Actinoplanes sp. NPDC051411]|uniref:toxin-antitoxin system HicB family antitoxin n=1 Tax=Actinoplanes sp. NPDC051411 TaxID=3155522 RepID=UPI003441EC4B
MDLMPYVELVRRELAIAAEAGGDEARALAERLTAPLESAIRLTLMEALAAAGAEITREMAPGSVWVRLNGRDPDFVVTLPSPPAAPSPEPEPEPEPMVIDEKSATARINLRLPEETKARVEEAAAREHVSVNSWLVHAATAALPGQRKSTGRTHGGGDSFQGWAR